MESIGEVSERIGRPYKWLRRQVIRMGLGQKVGWAIVLSETEVKELERIYGRKENTPNTSADHCAIRAGSKECYSKDNICVIAID